LANVLANEPASAARFAENLGSADVITFRDDSTSSSSTPSSGCVSTSQTSCGQTQVSGGSDDDDAEYDAQIAQVEEDIKRLHDQIKETEECAKRLTEQKSELTSLQEQRDHLMKEKEKSILQKKLEKQMRDLAEINKMSRALRTKFAELKHTQQLIKSRLTGTRSSLNQLDAEPEVTMSDINNAPDQIGSEVDAMHEAQQAILKQYHDINSKEVRDSIKLNDKVNLATRAGHGEQY
jgi:DNA repair exonuclease SbcCD ATPase subunit